MKPPAAVVSHVISVFLLSTCFVGIVVLPVFGLGLAKMERLFPAAIISLLSWTLLGFLAARVVEQPRPANHVTSLLEQKRLSLESPLRWHGRLRDEPARLPWSHGLEVDLAGVEYEGATLPLQGGLRVGLTPRPEQAPLPELHAGDEIAVLAEAKFPQVFRDEGAFDRRAYLAQQNIALVATVGRPQFCGSGRVHRFPKDRSISRTGSGRSSCGRDRGQAGNCVSHDH
jgi:uncharacterized protein DUF4131